MRKCGQESEVRELRKEGDTLSRRYGGEGQSAGRLFDRKSCQAERRVPGCCKRAPEGRQNVARGQSDEGAATPGEGGLQFSSSPGGAAATNPFPVEVSAAPLGLGNSSGSLTRGRRSALTPGYNL